MNFATLVPPSDEAAMLETALLDVCNTNKLAGLDLEARRFSQVSYLLLANDFDAFTRFHCGLLGFDLSAKWLL